MSLVAAFLITLGLGQLSATAWGLRGLSLVGPNRWLGYGAGALLLLAGVGLAPLTPWLLLWTPLAGLLAGLLLLAGGSFIWPPPHPDQLFAAAHPAHGGCRRVEIPDGAAVLPGLLLRPPPHVDDRGGAVCIVPGAGDSKTFFKWRLVKTLLAAGLTVLTIDPPGHGDNRVRPLVYPEALAAVPAALRFLAGQPGVGRVGVIGVSLGGALTLKSLASQTVAPERLAAAGVVVATPVQLDYHRGLFYREMWNTCYRAPTLELLRETTARQLRQSWRQGGYRSRHTTGELFDLLEPVESLRRLAGWPLLLVYSHRDSIAPPAHAAAMRQAAPHAAVLESKKASHVTLTLTPAINSQIADWLVEQLDPGN